MQFSDIHFHALYNCDDGPVTPEDMYKMVKDAYADGTRYLCVTPHFNPGYFGDNSEKIKESFDLLLEYVKNNLPDLHITLGNELRYNPGCENWLSAGSCRCMNNSKYVLVDFFEGDDKETISQGLDKLLSTGYIPILAHAELYKNIRGDLLFLKQHHDNGVLIQLDTMSVLGKFGFGARAFCKKILKNHLADFISSDAHNIKTRRPGIKDTYKYIENKYGTEYAEDICFKNAFHIIFER